MINPEELIATLKNQHIELNSQLLSILDNAESKEENINDKICKELKTFRKSFLEHIKIEDEQFYPDYFDKKNKGGKIFKEEDKLIIEMTEIIKNVSGFIEKYSTPLVIENDNLNFKKELRIISDAVNVRVETEEEGIFDFYLLL